MLSDGLLTITDPVWQPPARPSLLARVFGGLIRNERDLPFIRLSLLLTAFVWPVGVYLFVPGHFTWWLAPIYWAFYLWFLGPFVLMLHNTSHRVLFSRRVKILNKYIPWFLGPFFGQPPESYFAHHIGMHHVDGNLPSDLSSTMRYRRDSFVDFLKYFARFFFLGVFQLPRYLVDNGRAKLAKRFIFGEALFTLIVAGLALWNWQAALVVFIVPYVATRFLLMVGNWAQHAFVDPDDPANDYRSVVTFINSRYNHRCFNDGYHLGHHIKAGRHWLDMPADFLARRQKMIEERSLVFHTVDYFLIFLLLMLKQHRRLARYVVQLDPDNPMDETEILALFERRLARFEQADLAALEAEPARAT